MAAAVWQPLNTSERGRIRLPQATPVSLMTVRPAMIEVRESVKTATARKIAILFYNPMRFGTVYADPGASYYDEQCRKRITKGLHRRAAKFDFILQEASCVS